MVSLANLTQGETQEFVTENGTLYEVPNLETSGYNYVSVPLMGQGEYEISQVSAILAGEYYDHWGRLFLNWIDSEDTDHEQHIDTQDYSSALPYALGRTIVVPGPTRLVFKTFLNTATLLTFTCLVKELGV